MSDFVTEDNVQKVVGGLGGFDRPSPYDRKRKSIVQDKIDEIALNIFNKYDKDKSGYLDKSETLKMLDDILINQGRPKTTISQFNRFFADYDKNGDGVISRKEVTAFVKKFLGVPEDDRIEQLVQKIF